jgi:hypothetical protein
MALFPDRLTSQGMYGRWKKARLAQMWDKIPEEVQRIQKETPDYLRDVLGLEKKKRAGPESKFLPSTLVKQLDVLMASRVDSLHDDQILNEPMTSKAMRMTLVSAARKYSEAADAANAIITEKNNNLLTKWRAGEITERVARQYGKPLLSKAGS